MNGLISSINTQVELGGLKNRIHTGWITAYVGIGFHGDDACFPAIGRLELQRVLASVVFLVSNQKTL